MPGKIRIRPYDELFSMSLFGDIVARNPGTLPTDSQLLGKIILALFCRLHRLDPNDAALSAWVVNVIGGLEKEAFLEYEETGEKINPLDPLNVRGLVNVRSVLTILRDAKVSEPGKHGRRIVRTQKRRLVNYLEMAEKAGDPFPGNAGLRNQWLRKHESKILSQMSFPCGCHTNSSGDVVERSLQRIYLDSAPVDRSVRNCRTPGELVQRILSEWHGTSESTIKGLLGPKAPSVS